MAEVENVSPFDTLISVLGSQSARRGGQLTSAVVGGDLRGDVGGDGRFSQQVKLPLYRERERTVGRHDCELLLKVRVVQ